jgi:pyruvate carboxylase
LEEFHIVGIETNIPFCLAVIRSKKFFSGNYNTHFIQNEIEKLLEDIHKDGATLRKIAAIASSIYAISHHDKHKESVKLLQKDSGRESSWKISGRWENMR